MWRVGEYETSSHESRARDSATENTESDRQKTTKTVSQSDVRFMLPVFPHL